MIVSPTQYLVWCVGGTLAAFVERAEAAEHWEHWRFPCVHAPKDAPPMEPDIVKELHRWKCYNCGATGPRLWSPFFPVVLAHRFAFAVGTSQGLWCQAYEHGWPASLPFLEPNPSSVSLFVAATLDPEFWTGLPFTESNVNEAIPLPARPYVTVEWHPIDDLIPKAPITPEVLRQWL